MNGLSGRSRMYPVRGESVGLVYPIGYAVRKG